MPSMSKSCGHALIFVAFFILLSFFVHLLFAGESSAGINILLLYLRCLQTVNVRSKLDDFAQEIRRFAFPVRHRFGGVWMSRGKLVAPMLVILYTSTIYKQMRIGKKKGKEGKLTARAMAPRSSLCFCNSSSMFCTYVVRAFS